MLPTMEELYQRGVPVLHPSPTFSPIMPHGYKLFAVVSIKRKWGLVWRAIRKEIRNITDPIDYRKCFADQANKLHEIERIYFWLDDNETIHERR